MDKKLKQSLKVTALIQDPFTFRVQIDHTDGQFRVALLINHHFVPLMATDQVP
ncbi:hypothetical protein JI735_19660 [Paenibacillus sonchi]|uniref:Uncharacterized protein n=1 Tax=Paenibacillus sonchi TaxID=373687 RepID=A0A974SAM8_9BACL|nr:hypothetical protein [Paenibacillus sonchi]QQZ58947.1 hypothetical protein JI735_19660 [Paenibacillus sonchi]